MFATWNSFLFLSILLSTSSSDLNDVYYNSNLQFSGQNEKSDWAQSFETCKNEGGRLVVLNDEKLVKKISPKVQSNGEHQIRIIFSLQLEI